MTKHKSIYIYYSLNFKKILGIINFFLLVIAKTHLSSPSSTVPSAHPLRLSSVYSSKWNLYFRCLRVKRKTSTFNKNFFADITDIILSTAGVKISYHLYQVYASNRQFDKNLFKMGLEINRHHISIQKQTNWDFSNYIRVCQPHNINPNQV